MASNSGIASDMSLNLDISDSFAATTSSDISGDFSPLGSSTPVRKRKRSLVEARNCSQTTETSNVVEQLAEVKEELANVNESHCTLIAEVRALIADRSLSTSCMNKKILVPSHVKMAVRDGFTSGTDNGKSWDTSRQDSGTALKCSSATNTDMTAYVETYVRGLYPETEKVILNTAVERYFKSRKEASYRSRMGKQVDHKMKSVRYQRRRRKLLHRRQAIRNKQSWPEAKKTKVLRSMKVEYMSSESEVESEGDDNTTLYSVRPLPWISEEFRASCKDLDLKHAKSRSKKAKLQTVKRTQGIASSRKRPADVAACDLWVLA